MNDSFDGVPQRDQAADFFLWLPWYSVNGTSLTCEVDVCPASNSLLGSGSLDLARAVADTLGLDGAAVADWSISSFNTPFYSYDVRADELSDYLTPAWRLRLRLEGSDGAAPSDPVGPISFWGHDEEWIQHRTPWDFSAHETIVIALNGPDPELSFLDEVRDGLQVQVVIHDRPGFAVSQLRISLGVVPLPAAEDDLFDVLEACHRQAMIIHQNSAPALFHS